MNQGEQYKNIIDPLLKKVHKLASQMVDENSVAIDLACGNGTLAMMTADRAKKVTAIDLSQEMIDYAKIRAGAASIRNVDFIQMDARNLNRFGDNSFDFALTSMAIHQFQITDSISILKELKRIAKEIIIIDYAYPLPKGFKGIATRIIERIAGIEHNNNFKDYLRIGGLPSICDKCNLEIIGPEVLQSAFTVIKCR